VHFAVAILGPVQLGKPRGLPAFSAGGASTIIPWLTTFGGQTPVQRTVDSARHIGAAGIKVYSDVPAERVRELAAEGRRQGLKVWSHARIFPGKPSDAVEAGVEVLSHSSLLACEALQTGTWCDHRASVQSEPLARLFALMQQRKTILEPTLATLRYSWTQGGSQPERAKPGSILHWSWEATRLARSLGVRIAAGSDVPLKAGGALPAIHDEMELLVTRAGLTPLEALTAASRTGAEILGVDRTSGTVQVGKPADLVVLAADPSSDIRNTRRITHVIKGGHVTIVKGDTARH
jgi:imidazolonepropionase-like amidohydrolase